jgi:hypothetical protein
VSAMDRRVPGVDQNVAVRGFNLLVMSVGKADDSHKITRNVGNFTTFCSKFVPMWNKGRNVGSY